MAWNRVTVELKIAGSGIEVASVSPDPVRPKRLHHTQPNRPDRWDKVRWDVEVAKEDRPRLEKIALEITPKAGNTLQFDGLDGNKVGHTVKTKDMRGTVGKGDSCEYDVIVTAELDGSPVRAEVDPEIVIDDEPAGLGGFTG